ncbi:MAG: hypothetical protein UT24_C0003G0026 [Candidatus Woesebacteria bacterium GW2011_GWB1_39_12]|uniref:Uncharacterized protein n=1 Tax=Candidatus Woesebacteria bacterium GW2011_GWB1_39_12 TaxID=1618574 RepID=A0A0G0MC69_9BACT|nr:MAG: hypothetical protein UT24_C0003G0026 [Candidatus Woesebacteria bacterium GW2011_GWB1_39_12]
MTKLRVYDSGSSVARKVLEDKRLCIAEVLDYSGWHYLQCRRKRGYGPNGEYCKQHALIIAQGRHVNVPFKEREL